MFLKWCGGLVMMALLPASIAAETVVRYPGPESVPDERSRYPMRLLELVLMRADRPYRLDISPVRMVQARAILQLENNEGIDVISTMTSVEREARLQAIRIPIDKGLIGWRLLLINRAQASKFDKVRSLDDLAKLTAGQGSDWPDTPIMRANGLKVYSTSNYVSLFGMLESDRIDYFPRGVAEIWSEVAQHQPRLMVERSLVLHYPTAIYYFVRKGDNQLAADITAGLDKMIADGSFERLFQEYHGDLIKRASLRERKVIEMHNPLMPPSLPLARRQLWFRE